MYERPKILVITPESEDVKTNILSSCKEEFQEKTTFIIACFEVFIDNNNAGQITKTTTQLNF